MKYYEKLLDIGMFTRNELVQMVGSDSVANYIIFEYQKKGYIEKIKRDLHAVISLETGQPVLSALEIGGRLYKDACLSHHSAFEVYGYGNQVFFEIYVATKSRFRDFEYNGIRYHRVELKDGTDIKKKNMISVTGIEQTVIDSIRDLDKYTGLEELIRCILMIPSLNENKLLECLERNKNAFLYQKCGYIFEELQNYIYLSKNFFDECLLKIPNSRRKLSKETKNMVYNERWGIYTPKSLRKIINKGTLIYDDI